MPTTLQVGSSPGHTAEIVTIVLATDLRKVAPGVADDHEKITLHEIVLANVDEWLDRQPDEGRINDLSVFAGLYLAEKHSQREPRS